MGRFRVDNGKANMAPRGEAKWFRLFSIGLDNATPHRESDIVGVVTKWTPPDPVSSMTDVKKVEVLQSLSKGPDGKGSPWRASDKAENWVGRGIAKALDQSLADSEARMNVRKFIAAWLKDGSLEKRNEKDDVNRRLAPYIYVAKPG